jgi:flagellar biogenesis protein FliO
MMNFFSLTTAFNSVMGTVETNDIMKSLELMGKGMLGIFIVMVLIFVLIFLLNRFTGKKKEG